MRRALSILLLCSCFASCEAIRGAFRSVCSAQETVAGGVTEAGGFFGVPGKVAAFIINGALNVGCKILGLPAEGAAELGEALGISGGDDAAADGVQPEAGRDEGSAGKPSGDR